MADGVEAASPVSPEGTWDWLLKELHADADAVSEVDWDVSVDSSVIRAHQQAATARRFDVAAAVEERATADPHTGGGVE